jgi:DNA-binding MarR family transcriptional regulator
MSASLSLLKQLMEMVEKYDSEIGNDDLKEFAIFLHDKTTVNQGFDRSAQLDETSYQRYKSYPEVEFSTLLTSLFRFAKHYLKKAFLNSSFKTIDEFGFLATLLRNESLLKNELINEHLLEISSGSEILKRLIKQGLINEFADENDKRAKRVSITDKGKREIFMAFDDMHKVSKIIIGNLTGEELKQALAVFNKLSYFHHHIHEQDKSTDLHQLHQKYVENNL